MPPEAHRELSELRDRLAQRLIAVRRAMRGHFLAEGLAWFAAALVLVAAITLVLDWRLELSRPARIGMLLLAATGCAWLLYRRLLQPLLLPMSPLDVAAAIDRTHSGPASGRLASRVASVLELPDARVDPSSMSPELVVHAVRKNSQELENVSFSRHLNSRHLWLSLAAVAVAVAIPAGFAAAAPSVAKLWRDRWLLGSDRPWPHTTAIEVVGVRDGRLIVPRGESTGLQIKVTDTAEETETVWMRMQSDDGGDQTVTLNRFAAGDFRFDLPPLQQPANVTMWGGDGRAEPFRIEPLDRPKFTSLKLTATHPREKEVQAFDFTAGEGNVRLLPKTVARLEFETNVPVAEVRVKGDGTGPEGFVAIDDRHFAADWTHEGQVRLETVLVARDSGLESFPRPVSIGEKADRPPTVTLRHSGVRLRVTAQATIPVTLTVRDDYGLRNASLNVDVDGPSTPPPVDDEDPAKAGAKPEPASPVPSPVDPEPASAEASTEPSTSAPPKRGELTTPMFGPAEPAIELSVEQQTSVEIGALAVSPGQAVSVWAVADDDCYTGRQSATSRKITFKIVKDEELFREILLRQQQLRARLQKAYEQMLDLRERMKVAEIASDGANLLRSYLLTRREIAAVSREIGASLLEMRLNKLGGEESWRLIESTVTKPLARLQEQELERQKQGLETLVTSEPESMDSLIERQQAITDALKIILANMSQWDSFIDIINQVNSIIKIQEGARRMTEDLKSKQVESIFDN
ncbi:hypothetical protein Pan44_35830 [Caulifigura coniformis]|uniref:Uncharacterized protein n=1 Tax=Caulifigura coniformis TaxID=2527983 RepID=A0A517SHD6_9PLAN|nr:hypothetical protein [Caulifigura coniformis]QDT55539.1 hypothetical protein Pan44_35830 [Caulifigura coniformis]